MRYHRLATKRRGFTLVELLVTVTIVAVLAGRVFIISRRAINAAQNAECVANLRNLATAGMSYEAEHGTYPLSNIPTSSKPLRTIPSNASPPFS